MSAIPSISTTCIYNPLGDKSLDLTSCDVHNVVGVLYSCSRSGASVDSSDSSSPSDIDLYSSSSSQEP